LIAQVINSVGRSRAQNVLTRFRPWLPAASYILDIGAGTAHVTEALHADGHNPVACDITDLRFVSHPLVLADGTALPFSTGEFEVALLCTVLHHAPLSSQAAIISEGARVLQPGGRLLILEDVYEGFLEKMATRVVDAISNGALAGEPHSNRTVAEWTRLVDSLGLRMIRVEEFFAWFAFIRIRQALFVIECHAASESGN
jgi:SAM-dependent methyltransferase